MDNHNNIQQKKEKLLFCGMALAALGLVAASPTTASAKTTAPAQTTEQTTADKGNADTNKDKPIVRDWNGLKVTYDQKTHELTIPEGTIAAPDGTDPTPISAIDTNSKDTDFNEIHSINFKGKLTIKGSASGLFSNLPKLEKIDLTNVDTSNVTNMDLLFAFCSGLREIDGLTDTANVTSMGATFYGCSSLTRIDLSHFNTSKVTCMISMFNGCSSLTKLDLSNFDSSAVDMMDYMFTGDKSLASLNIGKFKLGNASGLGKAITMKNMLEGLDGLTNFTFNVNDDLSKTGFDTKAIWQEVGAGTPEKPAGKDKLSTSQLLAKYPVDSKQDDDKDTDKTVTYVKVAEDHSSVTPSTPSTPTVTAPVTNNNPKTKPTTPSTPKPIERPVYRTVMHNTYVYDQNGALKNGEYFAGQSIATYGTKTIDGKKYYALGDNSFVKANNISGIKRRLTHNAYLYNAKGKRANRKVLKKHKSVVTYGGSVKIHGKRFYIVGKNRYVKKANF
ncbi:SLAP domain-containing protein [Lactobacillus apis]|uniref:SLAP domain-containing protein n=1 Tax=Lactobacillus apis TaxID=303541 RepID=UPI00242E3049|nr:BspA family leucine-rich repeat surface protein [Lactobacillus apis]